MNLLRVVLIALLLCGTLPVLADDPPTLHIGPPSIDPQAPVAGEPLFIRFKTGPCVAIFDGPDDTDITLDGSTITFIVDGIRWSDPILCVVNFTTRVFPINAYPPGSYTLVAQLRYQNFFGQLIVETFGTVDFDVTGSPTTPQPVPTSNGYWLWLLTAGIVILTARHRRRWLSIERPISMVPANRYGR